MVVKRIKLNKPRDVYDRYLSTNSECAVSELSAFRPATAGVGAATAAAARRSFRTFGTHYGEKSPQSGGDEAEVGMTCPRRSGPPSVRGSSSPSFIPDRRTSRTGISEDPGEREEEAARGMNK